MFFEYLQNYLTILIFLFVAIGIGIAFIVVNFLCAPSKPDAEKLSAYECGFEPFEDSRMEFDVRFYLIAILFMIFDIEAMFLFPWASSLSNISSLGFWTMVAAQVLVGTAYVLLL